MLVAEAVEDAFVCYFWCWPLAAGLFRVSGSLSRRLRARLWGLLLDCGVVFFEFFVFTTSPRRGSYKAYGNENPPGADVVGTHDILEVIWSASSASRMGLAHAGSGLGRPRRLRLHLTCFRRRPQGPAHTAWPA